MDLDIDCLVDYKKEALLGWDIGKGLFHQYVFELKFILGKSYSDQYQSKEETLPSPRDEEDTIQNGTGKNMDIPEQDMGINQYSFKTNSISNIKRVRANMNNFHELSQGPVDERIEDIGNKKDSEEYF